MLEVLYLIVYFLSYAAGFSALIVTLFAIWKGAPHWIRTFFGFILASIFFMLTRNLGFFVKIFMGVDDLEKTIFFFVIYMLSCSTMVFFLTSVAMELTFEKIRKIGKILCGTLGIIPLLAILLLFFLKKSVNTGEFRLLLINTMMYYAYYVVILVLLFLFIRKKIVKSSLRRAIIDAELSVGASYFLFGTVHWLTYYKETYSLYPFSIINISLTLMFASSALIIGKKFLVPHRGAMGNSVPNMLIPDLTEIENKIIGMIQLGATNKEISEKLVLTLTKVKNINYKIFSRFNVNSRTELLLVLRDYVQSTKLEENL